MFDRLGKLQDLPPVVPVAVYRTQTFKLCDLNAEEPAAEKPVGVPEPTPVETEVIIQKFLKAHNERPKKKLRSDLNAPVLTDRLPKQEDRVSPTLSPKYVSVFSQMQMGGVGFRVPKGFGKTASLFLRRWLDINGLQGRPLVQFWPDADMVFWVRGDGTTQPSVE